jgi:hypothetical protein
VTVAAPAATAVTRPPEETVAIAGFDDDQVTARLASTDPLASRTVAVSREVSPFVSVTVDGTIAMAAAGTAVTDTDAVASSPSADACIAVVPSPTPDALPAVLIAAMASFSVLQVITRLGMTIPFASSTEALNWPSCPTTIERLGGVIAMDAGAGAPTVSDAAPTFASLMALIVTVLFARAVTTPLAFTVAIAGFELCQATVRPVRTLPSASFTIAVACVV